MTPALNAIQDSLHTPLSFLSQRANLNLPGITTKIALSLQQREALELMISSSPIAIVMGIPGSGKTRVAKQAVSLMIKYQKSILVIAQHGHTLQEYQELGLDAIILDQDCNYEQKAYTWLRKKLTNPSLCFVDAYSFPDKLLDHLQSNNSLHRCLELVVNNQENELEDGRS